MAKNEIKFSRSIRSPQELFCFSVNLRTLKQLSNLLFKMDFAYFFLSAIRVKSIQIFFHEFEFKKSILTAIKFKALIEPPVATSSKTSTSLNAYEENYRKFEQLER